MNITLADDQKVKCAGKGNLELILALKDVCYVILLYLWMISQVLLPFLFERSISKISGISQMGRE